MIIKVVCSYDGYAYCGWQKQINAIGIQSIIEKALNQITQENNTIVASGRTDAKVHALGQVFHFETQKAIPPVRYVNALNAMLPKDIRVLSAEKMDDDFHARFSAISKRYDYYCSYDINDPFLYRYRNFLYKPVDIDVMLEGANYLLGTHDFTSFSSSHIDPRKPRVKTITRLEIKQEGNDIHFIYEGTGFLRYQVRMMTGTLIAVGQHKIDPITVKTILDQKDKDACRYNADPCGLYLVEVKYDTSK